MAKVDEVAVIRTVLEAYATGVRAGVITPCLQDENAFRSLLKLPLAPKEVEEDWIASSGIRRPITLAKPSITAELDTEEEPQTTIIQDEAETNEE